MAERHSAIHAASTLFAQVILRHLLMKLLPIKHTFSRQSSDWKSAGEFDEPGFRHCQSVPTNWFLLPLPLGEGWGEGLGISSAFLSPHPQPFSQGRRERTLSAPNSRQVVRVRFECGHCRLCVTHPITPPSALRLQHPAIVIRDDPHEFGQPLIPRNQNLSSTHAARDFDVAKDHVLDCFNLFFVVQGSEFYHFDIAPPRKITISVEHICQSARHTRAKISSSSPEHDDASAGHVFAAVIATSFNHDKGATG